MAEKTDSFTEKQKAFYSLGFQRADELTRILDNPDVEATLKGFKDGLEGKDPEISIDDMQKYLSKIQEGVQKKHQEEMAKLSDKNKEVAEEFLKENAKNDGIETTMSGLQYKVLEKSTKEDGKSPTDASTVKVHYKLELPVVFNGEKDKLVEDSSKAPEVPQFPLNGVVPGFREVLKLMKEGDKFEAFLPPSIAYGENGNQMIPPNQLLKFTLELVEVVS